MEWRLTPQISDAPMRVTQNKFMVGARSLHLLVRRLARAFWRPTDRVALRRLATFGYKIADSRNQIAWYFHQRLTLLLRRGLVFRHGLLVGLGLVVREHPLNSRFVPTLRKL